MAYLLLCHKNPKQINIFINQLLRYGDCDIYIHMDIKSKSLCNQIKKNERVHCFSKYNVRWGSFEIVLAGLYLMKKAIDSNNTYTHFYFGTGQDLLVKNGLYDYLGQSSADAFIHIKGEITNNNRAAARYLISWPKKLMIRDDWHPYRFIRIAIQLLCSVGIKTYPNKEKLLQTPKFYEGHTWFIAKNEVIKYIVDYCSEHKDYVNYWKNSLASDLMFFQTIIMNSPYKDNLEDELMYVNFGKTFGTMNHPLTITMENCKELKNGKWFCARKFETEESELSKRAINYFINSVTSSGKEG